uniref:Ovule protein n=1 Tax=Romanomermis culicivorax TaxID=13658 RepID=A0A915IKU3_ROMCU
FHTHNIERLRDAELYKNYTKENGHLKCQLIDWEKHQCTIDYNIPNNRKLECSLFTHPYSTIYHIRT